MPSFKMIDDISQNVMAFEGWGTLIKYWNYLTLAIEYALFLFHAQQEFSDNRNMVFISCGTSPLFDIKSDKVEQFPLASTM